MADEDAVNKMSQNILDVSGSIVEALPAIQGDQDKCTPFIEPIETMVAAIRQARSEIIKRHSIQSKLEPVK